MASLVKIPFILLTTLAVTTSLTNPTTPVTDKERRPSSSKNTALFRFWFKNSSYFIAVIWFAGAAEITAILSAKAFQMTSSKTAATILRYLMLRGTSSDTLLLTTSSTIGFLLIILGTWIRLNCYRTLDRFFTFEISILEDHQLITHGPYNYVRHPSYAGSLLVYVGLWFWFGSSGSWLRESAILETLLGQACVGIFAAIYTKLALILIQRLPEEDRLLREVFTKEWEEWARRVPYSLIPGIY